MEKKTVFLSLFFFLTNIVTAQTVFVNVGNAIISVNELPVLEPNSVSTSAVSDLDFEDLTLDHDNEVSSNTYNEQDIEFIEASGEYGEDIFISTFPIVEPDTINLGGNGTLTITRKDTGETLTVTYRDKSGNYLDEAFGEIKRVMRCSLEAAEIKIPKLLVELLDAIEDKFGKKGIILLSGYRTKDLNDTVPGSAKQSLHMLGWAADIRISGYSSKAIKNFAKKLEVGGVGYYPDMRFVHVDIGDVRYWERSTRRYKKGSSKKASIKKVSASSNLRKVKQTSHSSSSHY